MCCFFDVVDGLNRFQLHPRTYQYWLGIQNLTSSCGSLRSWKPNPTKFEMVVRVVAVVAVVAGVRQDGTSSPVMQTNTKHCHLCT